MKQYAEYKDSGIPWIGKIPSDWNVKRLRYLGALNAGGVDKKIVEGENLFKSVHYMDVYRGSLHNIFNSDNYLVVSATKQKADSCSLNKGDVLFTSSSETPEDIGHSCVIGEDLKETLFGYHLMRFRPSTYGFLHFEKYMFGANYMRQWFSYRAVGMTRYGISNADFSDAQVVLPPVLIQQQMATYLDRKTAAIDAVIADKEKQITLLQEKRTAIISKVVTKGLDPTVPMKDSGVDWIGKVPSSWSKTVLKYCISTIESGVSVNSEDQPAAENQLGVLKTSCVFKGKFDETQNKTVLPSEVTRVACPLKTDTIIVSRMNTPQLVGACGYVEKTYANLFLPDRLWQVSLVENVLAKYMWYFLSTKYVRDYYASICTGTSNSMQNISQGQFLNMWFFQPSVCEQTTIVKYLDMKIKKVDNAIDDITQQIERLKEYRQSVISEVVTGKVMVEA